MNTNGGQEITSSHNMIKEVKERGKLGNEGKVNQVVISAVVSSWLVFPASLYINK